MLRITITLYLCIAAAVVFIVPVVNADTETFEKTYDVNPGTRFEIINHDGGIEITGWDQNRIDIHAIKKTRWGGKLKNVAIDVSPGENFRVETIPIVKKPKVSVHYNIKMPYTVIVRHVSTSNGRIELEGTRGNIEVITSNGAIEVDGSEGDIDASTSNGAIELEGVKGFVSAHTSNGAIDVERTAGVIALKTSNGSIEADVLGVRGDGVRLHTSNGAIHLRVDPGLNIDLEAKTSNGKITVEDLEVVVKEITKTSLKGRLGKGGTKVSCRTSNGAIDLKRLK